MNEGNLLVFGLYYCLWCNRSFVSISFLILLLSCCLKSCHINERYRKSEFHYYVRCIRAPATYVHQLHVSGQPIKGHWTKCLAFTKDFKCTVQLLNHILPDMLSIMLCLSSGTGMSWLPSRMFEMQGLHSCRSLAVMYPNRINECTNFKVWNRLTINVDTKSRYKSEHLIWIWI